MSTTAALDIRMPFTRAEALAAGLTDNDLRSARFVRIFRGVFVAATIRVSALHRGRAALKLVSDPIAHLSHVSAARIHELPIPVLPGEHVTVADPRARRRTKGVRCHVAPGSDVTTVDGVPVSSPLRTFVELGTFLGLVDLVVVGDWLVRRRLTTLPALREFANSSRLLGAEGARAAVDHVRERVDSPMETRIRMLLVLAGLPEPEVNRSLRDRDGNEVRKHDLAYFAVKTAIEYQGRHHVEVVDNWESDITRREESDNEAWRVVEIVANDIYRSPHNTLRRVWAILKSRGLPGLPARPGDDWRPHFPGY